MKKEKYVANCVKQSKTKMQQEVDEGLMWEIIIKHTY